MSLFRQKSDVYLKCVCGSEVRGELRDIDIRYWMEAHDLCLKAQIANHS